MEVQKVKSERTTWNCIEESTDLHNKKTSIRFQIIPHSKTVRHSKNPFWNLEQALHQTIITLLIESQN